MAAPLDAAVVASLEATLGAAVKASLGLPVDDRPGFIAKYCAAANDGGELPTAVPRDPATVASLGDEMPALAALLSQAVNEVAVTKSGATPLKTVADFLLQKGVSSADSVVPAEPAAAVAATDSAPAANSAAAPAAVAPVAPAATPAAAASAPAAAAPVAAAPADAPVAGAPAAAPAAPADAPAKADRPAVESGSMLWSCRCGVSIALKGEPLYSINCHCTHCLPVVQYIDHKSDSVPDERKGISAVSDTGLGVAKAFYLLEDVSFLGGREKLVPVKRSSVSTNVRMYTSCCNTLCVCDSGKSMPHPWRSFNRNAITAADGSAYKPVGVCNAFGEDNPDFDSVPQPKANGLPESITAKLETVWHADLEPPERDEHAGPWAPPPKDSIGAETGGGAFFYMDPEPVGEFAVAVVGLENALTDYIEKERERALEEKKAAEKKAAEEAEAARVAAEAAKAGRRRRRRPSCRLTRLRSRCCVRRACRTRRSSSTCAISWPRSWAGRRRSRRSRAWTRATWRA